MRGLYSGVGREEVRDSCFLLGKKGGETPSFLLQPTLFPTTGKIPGSKSRLSFNTGEGWGGRQSISLSQENLF